MKTNSKYILIAVLFLILSSCSDFLENEAFSDISKTNFYKTLGDYEKAMTGSYFVVSGRGLNRDGNYAFGTVVMGECGTDEMWANYNKGSVFDFVTQLDQYHSLSPGNIICQEIWLNHYKGIAATNEIITRIDQMPAEVLLETPRYSEIKAEAAFLQALWYFNLVRAFGGVPVVTKPAEGTDDLGSVQRNSIKEVYSHIQSLLEFSKQHLPKTITQFGRSRQISAYALSAKVNLHIASSMNLMEKSITNNEIRLNGINAYTWTLDNLSSTETIKKYYTNAKEDADFVLREYSNSHGGAYLMPKFTDCFYPHESSDEILFEAVLSTGLATEMGGWLGSIYGPMGLSKNGGGQHILFMNPAIVMDTYTFTFKGTNAAPDFTVSADERFNWTIATNNLMTLPSKPITVANAYKQFEIGKFRIDEPAPYNQDRTPINNPILRMSDVCLIYAEAVSEINELNSPGSEVPADALEFINVVRTRAGLTKYLYGTQNDAGAGKVDYKDEILYDQIKVVGNKEIKGYKETVCYAGGSPIGHFRRALLNERLMELCAEGHRWYDLVRMGVLKPVVDGTTTYTATVKNINIPGTNLAGAAITQPNVARKRDLTFPNRTINDYHIYRPIPEREISLHKGNLLQNYGY